MKLTREELEQLKQDLINDLMSKVEVVEDTYELEYPDEDEIFYYVNNVGRIDYAYYADDWKQGYERGLLFKTKEEAERFAKERQLLFKIKQWAEEKNGDWKPDWDSDDILKYFIRVNKNDLFVDYNYSNNFISKLPYFKSQKITQECIDLFGDEILEVLN
ncbi:MULTISPECIES: hypothetical protein [Gemella]|uniref:hypothetical protein n=1 Tax=Gemella TaxID=1378 RepID=UPI000931AA9A|nr:MULTISPECIES: hypothetical protein [Gemella]AXI27276.1 hypothetical protein CG018_07600 [Gemella sp. ND 6198]